MLFIRIRRYFTGYLSHSLIPSESDNAENLTVLPSIKTASAIPIRTAVPLSEYPAPSSVISVLCTHPVSGPDHLNTLFS